MTPTLSPNTQAILLVTAPLIAGRGTPSPDPLSPGEFKHLARHLRDIQLEPADLLSPRAAELIHDCQSVVDEARLQRLLDRGFLLSQVVERWQSRAIWVVSRADAIYPQRLKARLSDDAPSVLYGCGDLGLLEAGGLAVVGSRDVSENVIAYTRQIGQLAARAGIPVVSGGARGIDQASMRSALEHGGTAMGVLSDSLERSAMNRDSRNMMIKGRLVLISSYDPNAGFNVGNAMRRNRLIYALSDAALVVNSDVGKGGTWAGATEQLGKLRMVPVYVRSTGETSAGLDALLQKGALSWPGPRNAGELRALLSPEAQTDPMDRPCGTDAPPTPDHSISRPATAQVQDKDAQMLAARDALQRLLVAPMKDTEIAAAMDMPVKQTKRWLTHFVDQGVLEKTKKPTAYVLRQPGLFG